MWAFFLLLAEVFLASFKLSPVESVSLNATLLREFELRWNEEEVDEEEGESWKITLNNSGKSNFNCLQDNLNHQIKC